jgi:hypothetical protein
MSVVAILISGFSVSISFKIKSNLDFKFTLSGENIMKLIVTCMLADITGGCGDCNSYYVQHLNHTLK